MYMFRLKVELFAIFSCLRFDPAGDLAGRAAFANSLWIAVPSGQPPPVTFRVTRLKPQLGCAVLGVWYSV